MKIVKEFGYKLLTFSLHNSVILITTDARSRASGSS